MQKDREFPSATDADARAAALAFARAMATWFEAELGPRLLGFYLLGSLAHGGFNRRYSDIDVGLIAAEPLSEAVLEAMRAHGRAIAPDQAAKTSLFWTDRGFSVGRFPPLDRADYLDHGVPLVERERVRPPRPTIADVRAYLGGAPFERWAETARRMAALDRLEPAERKPYLRALLYPARFVYSWITGGMASNDDAVAFLAERAPDGLDVALAERALACRHAAADPDLLFPERRLLPAQVEGCARIIAG